MDILPVIVNGEFCKIVSLAIVSLIYSKIGRHGGLQYLVFTMPTTFLSFSTSDPRSGSASSSAGGMEYSNQSYRGWTMSPEEQQRLAAPVAQKKHQMYGKRYFQDSTPPPPQHGG